MSYVEQQPQASKELIAQLAHHGKEWIIARAKLARSEMKQNVSTAITGAILIVSAVLFALVAIHALAIAAIFGLSLIGLSYGLSALMVAAGFFVIAAGFGLWGKSKLASLSLIPERTMTCVKDDIDTLQENIHV